MDGTDGADGAPTACALGAYTPHYVCSRPLGCVDALLGTLRALNGSLLQLPPLCHDLYGGADAVQSALRALPADQHGQSRRPGAGGATAGHHGLL